MDKEEMGPPNVDVSPNAQVENHETNLERSPHNHKRPIMPGGVEVPTLDNLFGGGPSSLNNNDEHPSARFVEENTRNMMQSNSDYKVPGNGMTILIYLAWYTGRLFS